MKLKREDILADVEISRRGRPKRREASGSRPGQLGALHVPDLTHYETRISARPGKLPTLRPDQATTGPTADRSDRPGGGNERGD